MSAPHVSGTAALIWALQPGWSADQVSQAITSTARDAWSPGKDNLTGWGVVDAGGAAWGALNKFYFPLVLAGIADPDMPHP